MCVCSSQPKLANDHIFRRNEASVATPRCTDFVLLKQMLVQLRLYPLVLILVWAFATINRLQQLFEPHQQVFWLYAAQVGKFCIVSRVEGGVHSIRLCLNSWNKISQTATQSYLDL